MFSFFIDTNQSINQSPGNFTKSIFLSRGTEVTSQEEDEDQ